MINVQRYAHAALMTIFLVAGASLLNSCGGSTLQQTSPSSSDSSASRSTTGRSAEESAQTLLAAAAKTSGKDAFRLKLDAAEILLRNKRSAVAKNVLDEIRVDALNGNDLGRYSLMKATIAGANGDADKALHILDNPRLLQAQDTLPVELQIKLSQQRARALTQKGQHIASAQQRIFVSPLLTDAKQSEKNQRAIWKSLSSLNLDTLKSEQTRTSSQDYRGWIELMLVYKNSTGGIDTQVANLNAWLVRWASHPAAQSLPPDLAMLREIATQQPKSIAVLLPSSGREKSAGDAIRDGFMAAYFQSDKRSRPKVSFYDTAANTNFLAIYQKAVADGAQVIIGPLLKDQVKALQQMPQVPVPTLALNSIDDALQTPANLFQFSLSLNDEAVQIADIASGERFQRAAIMGVRTDWATRAADSFRQHWKQVGGTIVDEIWFEQYGADYASRIESSLLINESRARAKEIQRILGRNVEFEPRRRQDIDVIFFVGKAEQARTIKPMMTYYYADAIPIYATSSIYAGIADAARDQDLEGIHFTETPWILDNDDIIKQTIVTYGRMNAALARLTAMGADAFRLYPRLRQLEMLPDVKLQGSTGELSMSRERVVKRRLAWAEFSQGLARPAPMALSNDDDSSMQDAIDANTPMEQNSDQRW